MAATVALAACGEARPGGEPATSAIPAEPQYGGELIYALSGETYSLFPGRQPGSDAQDAWLYALEGLVEINEENEIIPLAGHELGAQRGRT